MAPSHKREDLKYGDPHLNHGAHPFYGPDRFAVIEWDNKETEEKPTMESHGFYLAHENKERKGLLERIRQFFLGDKPA
jgi:hypothetical protein